MNLFFLRTGLLVTAAIAIAAVTATPAFAAAEFEASEYPVTVSGESSESQAFALPKEGEVKCKKASFGGGQLSSPSATVSLLPAYSECTAFGSAATVEMAGCTYVYAPASETEAHVYQGKTEIACPAGKHITIVALGGLCEVQIGGQSGLATTTFTDNLGASPPTVTVKQGLEGVHANVTKDGFLCPLTGTGERTNGTLGGASTLKAFFGAEAAGIAAAPTENSLLCKELPNELTGECAIGKVYKAETKIEAAIEAPDVATFILESTPVPSDIVTCKGGTVWMITKAEEGTPLPAESGVFAFSECTNVAKTACTVQMVNGNTGIAIVSSRWLRPGFGNLWVELVLQIECGAEIHCRYRASTLPIRFGGDNDPEIGTEPAVSPFSKSAIGGEVGCTASGDLVAFYKVSTPKPVSVTR